MGNNFIGLGSINLNLELTSEENAILVLATKVVC